MLSGGKSSERGDVMRIVAAAAVAFGALAGAYFVVLPRFSQDSMVSTARAVETSSARAATRNSADPLAADYVDVKEEELKTIKVEAIGERVFTLTR
jgi:hypothetical protein